MKHILIPSQIPVEIKQQIENKKLFDGCIIDVRKEIIWSKFITYWVVPDTCLVDIDDIIKVFPNVILIFWFIYAKNKSLYDEIIEKYKDNVLNIDLFTTPDDILLMMDENNQINKEGFYLLDHMIRRF
jgi:hypothetical protein